MPHRKSRKTTRKSARSTTRAAGRGAPREARIREAGRSGSGGRGRETGAAREGAVGRRSAAARETSAGRHQAAPDARRSKPAARPARRPQIPTEPTPEPPAPRVPDLPPHELYRHEKRRRADQRGDGPDPLEEARRVFQAMIEAGVGTPRGGRPRKVKPAPADDV